MTHGNSIINGYGIKFSCKIPCFFNDLLYLLSNVMKVGVTRNELGEGVGNSDYRCRHLGIGHAISLP